MNAIICSRYILFFVLASLFATQCAIAVWDVALFTTAGTHGHVDIFLIFTGASGILLLFSLSLVDIAREDALFSRVWFELSWVFLYFVFEVIGGALLLTLNPACRPDDRLSDVPCPSTKALTGITWASMAILLLYILALGISSILHQSISPAVWNSGVRDFPWYAHRRDHSQRLESAPGTPVGARNMFTISRSPVSRPAAIVQPVPRRVKEPPVWTNGDALRPAYEIEPYLTDNLAEFAVRERRERSRLSQPPSAPQVLAMRQATLPSLYPHHLQATLPLLPKPEPIPSPPEPSPSSNQVTSAPRREVSQRRLVSSESAPTTVRTHTAGTRRPSGPRNRPAPLDLSQATTYRSY